MLKFCLFHGQFPDINLAGVFCLVLEQTMSALVGLVGRRQVLGTVYFDVVGHFGFFLVGFTLIHSDKSPVAPPSPGFGATSRRGEPAASTQCVSFKPV
jgi:hypothetical protein